MRIDRRPYLQLDSIVMGYILQLAQDFDSLLEVRHLLQVRIADLMCQGP